MNSDNKIGFFSGLTGGSIKAIMSGFDWSQLFQVAIFALVSGFLGIMGKKIFECLYYRLFKKRKDIDNNNINLN